MCRRRAREVADAKMKSWKETMSTIPKHRQQEMEQQNRKEQQRLKISNFLNFLYNRYCHR
jgi:hypothetical protein